MAKNSEIRIEKFRNGITIIGNEVEGHLEPEKSVAITGEEAKIIGEFVWDSIHDMLEQSENGVVKVQISVDTL